MKNSSPSRFVLPLPDVEQTLQDLCIPYERQADGTLLAMGNIDLASEGLTRLPDLSSVVVRGGFTCAYNMLTNLAGAPKQVDGFFSCYNNKLTSLKGAPRYVRGNFSCHDNMLTCLEGAPTIFRELLSDMGKFKSWDDVPESLRVSDETRALRERQIQFEQDILDAPILQAPVTIQRPLRLKKPGR